MLQKIMNWFKENLYRLSLTQLTLFMIFILLCICTYLEIRIINLGRQTDVVSIIGNLDVYQDTIKYLPFVLVSFISGFFGAKCRIYMDEMRIARMPGFAHLSEERRDKLLRDYGFGRHNYLLGIVAAFVAIVTLGEELSVLHQMVIGILSSMVGGQFLEQRLDGGGKESPNLDILLKQLEHEVNQMNEVESGALEQAAPAKAKEMIDAIKSETQNV